jgi:glycosyltransferase involved in cell wall biosynthesis
MCKLQILVNHYKEDETITRRFLESLSTQKDVNFNVLICSDGGGVRLSDSLKGFTFKITYAYAPHSGVCHTRNLLLDKSDAEYVMFCDIDDVFT